MILTIIICYFIYSLIGCFVTAFLDGLDNSNINFALSIISMLTIWPFILVGTIGYSFGKKYKSKKKS